MLFYWFLLKLEVLVIVLYIEVVGMEVCYLVVYGLVKLLSNICILCLMLFIFCMYLVSGMCLLCYVYENVFCFVNIIKENDVFF